MNKIPTLESLFYYSQSSWWMSCLSFFMLFTGIYLGGIGLMSIYLKVGKQKGSLVKIYSNTNKQTAKTEIRRSFLSITVFSLQAIVFQWCFAKGYFNIQFDNPWVLLWEVPIMFLWNEIHFYASHWLLHRKWWFKHVHYVHHLSKEPTIFSIFSFHWIEAFLLGTVIFFPLAIHEFYVGSLLSLPLMSGMLNLFGHSNHIKVSSKDGTEKQLKFIFRHTMHHKWSQGNYGFMLSIFDKLFKTELPKNKK